MKKLRWQLIIIFLTGLVVGVLLLAEQPSIVTPPVIATTEPVKGGIYTEALIGSFQRLNPMLDGFNSPDHEVDRLIFSGLVRFNGEGIPEPDLAESWGISKDGSIYNFSLRSNARWHDGKPVSSEDVLFTIDLYRKGGQLIPEDVQAFWKDVDVKVLNEVTLQFRLPEPFAPFLDYLTFGILPKHLLMNVQPDQMVNIPFNLQPVGSGPYQFDGFLVENDKIAGVNLKSFNDYYGKKPYLEQVAFRYYPTATAALQAYHTGTVLGISQVTNEILQPVLTESNLMIYSGRKPELAMILFNLNQPDVAFFKDVSVRRGLMAGLNRRAMIDRLLKGQAIQADGPILPGTWAYYEGIEKVGYDTQAAKDLLKKAGYLVPANQETVRKKDNISLSFKLIYPDDTLHLALAQAIQKDWAAINVGVELEAVPYDQLISERLEQRNYQAALVDLNLAHTPDPDPYLLWDQAQATGGQNYSNWDNRTASEFLEQARITIDISERTRLYHNFQVVFSQELPALPLFNPIYSFAIDRQIQGVRIGSVFDSSDRFSNQADWFLTGKQLILPTATK